MPRPVKCRKVCHFPNVLEFLPADNAEKKVPIVLTVDEYETIRLLDKKGYSQEQCAVSMQIARTTVQRIYEIARKKIADALIDGHPLRIEGGDFRICDGQSSNCSFGGCYKQEIYKKYAAEKGEGIMRIAVTYENGQIFQHFGHTETFKIYDVEEGKVVHSEVVDTNGSGHGALAGVLNALNADVLICGGIGGGAQTALAAAGIKLFGGVSGDADKAVEAFINETGSSSPAPGGGSIAALNAASGAALIEMVAALTIGKEKYAAVEAEMKTVLDTAHELKARFLSLIDKDSNAFNKIMAAFKLPKGTDEEKAARSAAIQSATKEAALVPFEIGETAFELFALAEAVIKKGNSNAVTDGAVAAMNARIAVKGAFLNVKINLGSIKDQNFVTNLQTKMAAIEATLDEKEKTLLEATGL